MRGPAGRTAAPLSSRGDHGALTCTTPSAASADRAATASSATRASASARSLTTAVMAGSWSPKVAATVFRRVSSAAGFLAAKFSLTT